MVIAANLLAIGVEFQVVFSFQFSVYSPQFSVFSSRFKSCQFSFTTHQTLITHDHSLLITQLLITQLLITHYSQSNSSFQIPNSRLIHHSSLRNWKL